MLRGILLPVLRSRYSAFGDSATLLVVGFCIGVFSLSLTVICIFRRDDKIINI